MKREYYIEFSGGENVCFTSSARTKAGLIAAAKKALRKRYGSDEYPLDIEDFLYNKGCSCWVSVSELIRLGKIW